MIRELLFDDTVMSQFIANPHHYSPRSFNLHPNNNQAEVNEVAAFVRNSYFNGQHPSAAQRFNWTQYQTDMQFTMGIDRVVRYHAARQTQPIYYYKFSFDGSLNMVKRLLLLTDYDGAVHGDVSFNDQKELRLIILFLRTSSTYSMCLHSQCQFCLETLL